MSFDFQILLPVKNAMPYLTEALESLAIQDACNFEVWAWDNGSTDNSLEVLKQWIPNRLPGTITENRVMGLGATLASMVEESPYPILFRMDGDDRCRPTRLHQQYEHMLAHPDLALCGTQVQWIGPDGLHITGTPHYPESDAAIGWQLRFANSLIHPSVVFRREAILEAGNYQDMMPGQDYDLWMRLCLHPRWKINNLTEVLLDYRRHPKAVTSTSKTNGENLHGQLIAKYHQNLFPSSELSDIQDLIDLLIRDFDRPVQFRHRRLLKHLSIHAARAKGQHEAYYQSSPRYQLQARILRDRWICHWPVIKQLRHVLRSQAK